MYSSRRAVQRRGVVEDKEQKRLAVAMKIRDQSISSIDVATYPIRAGTINSGLSVEALSYLEGARIGSRALSAKTNIWPGGNGFERTVRSL